LASNLSEVLSKAFKKACLAELEALKPGNVHIFADGHGMVVHDFVTSAEAAALAIAQPDLGVGQRIFNAVDATWQAVSCNTNLGIILLAAPLLHAATNKDGKSLREHLMHTLDGVSQEDAAYAFRAISLANPAGLGQHPEHDVNDVPSLTLLEAMTLAQDRDLVARQYANYFADIFELGLPTFNRYFALWDWPAWATTSVYLTFMKTFPDSHIARKFGIACAQQIQGEAAQIYHEFVTASNPKTLQAKLLKWDASLKARGINPGTSADLTVATILVVELEKL
jgi:triphosphoribosyl-dephospho-CoA synthase